jgi:general secretion pathway protein E
MPNRLSEQPADAGEVIRLLPECITSTGHLTMSVETTTLEPAPELAGHWWACVRRLAAESGSLELPEWEPQDEESVLAFATRLQVPADIQTRAASEILEVDYHKNLSGKRVAASFIREFPIAFAREHSIVAIDQPEGDLRLVMGGLASWYLVDLVERLLLKTVAPAFAPAEAILQSINGAYQQQTSQVDSLIDSLDYDSIESAGRLTSAEDLLDVADRPPVIKLVNLMLFDAVQASASDIHIQPTEGQLTVRLRIDGVLFDVFHIPKEMQEEVISRVKILGKMNIAEKRLPQDGRATVQIADRLIDLRIASLPASHGERVVIRLLDKSARLYTLTELGMDQEALTRFQSVIHLEHGLVLVTGPTGSGKSTTLYAALQEINTKDRNVVTLEDPIEYQLEGISQTQVNTKKGLTFASGLRNVLRQDPDIIMIGEIRDHETAVMAIQSALTGHLVFSTLHTNDAASAITRMLDLGIEPYLLSSSLLAVMAQRLVRQVCRKCGRERSPVESELSLLEEYAEPIPTVAEGAGCEVCRQSGYRGRVGIFELLQVSDAVRDKIQQRASATQIRQSGLAADMKLLRDDGLIKIARGVTTPAEVQRVTMRASM